MKKLFIVACVAMLAACGQQAEEKKPAVASLDSEQAKLSYAIGLDIGSSLKTLETDLDRDIMAQAIADRLDGTEPKLSAEEANKVKQAFFKAQAEKKQAEAKAQGEKNKAAGAAFLAEHAKKEGVTVTDSGLHFRLISEGDGPKPKPEDIVRVHYKGTLIDGTEFDSSYSRGEPATFPLNAVIKGWTEGLQLMKVGSKAELVLPPELAYGEHGAGGKIGPNSTLIFEVELLGIGAEQPAAEGAAQ